MRRIAVLCWALLVVAAGLLVNLSGCGGSSSSSSLPPPPPPPPPSQKIQHVVVIFQENRTPDNLFQDPVLIARGADIAGHGMNSLGQSIALVPRPLADSYDLQHSHGAFLAMYDGGKMDGADKVLPTCLPGVAGCPPPNPQFVFVNPAQVGPYFQLAEQYVFADRMFQTNQGPSFPAHQFIISGTSAPTAPPDPASNLFVSGNTSIGTGCAAPPAATVSLIDPSGSETQTMYPCFEHPTLTDLLNAKSIGWRYYTPSPNSIWTGPNAIQHMCGPNAPPPNATACTGPDWTHNVIQKQAQILNDIAAGQLAPVSWVIPTGQASDHPTFTDGSGPSWVASVVNAIGNSQYWSNTAIFITWDDWGGFYDHVPPPAIINSYEYGFRVPLIVVSPFAKAGYISHVTHDFGSILKFIENTFSLPSLGYADARADDLSDCFNFGQAPLTFLPITAQFNAAHFLNDTRPPLDPDDD